MLNTYFDVHALSDIPHASASSRASDTGCVKVYAGEFKPPAEKIYNAKKEWDVIAIEKDEVYLYSEEFTPNLIARTLGLEQCNPYGDDSKTEEKISDILNKDPTSLMNMKFGKFYFSPKSGIALIFYFKLPEYLRIINEENEVLAIIEACRMERNVCVIEDGVWYDVKIDELVGSRKKVPVGELLRRIDRYWYEKIKKDGEEEISIMYI